MRCTYIPAEKPFLYKAFDELGIRYWPSEANFILFKSPLPVQAFMSRVLDEGVMVRSAEVMRAKGCVRVTSGMHVANEAFVKTLHNL